MISDIIDFFWDLIKELFKFIYMVISEVIVVIFKDFWFILLGLIVLGLIWYSGGGYQRAEQNYQAEQKKADEKAALIQQLDAQKQANPNAGVYIVK